jgi:hypothetical protein
MGNKRLKLAREGIDRPLPQERCEDPRERKTKKQTIPRAKAAKITRPSSSVGRPIAERYPNIGNLCEELHNEDLSIAQLRRRVGLINMDALSTEIKALATTQTGLRRATFVSRLGPMKEMLMELELDDEDLVQLQDATSALASTSSGLEWGVFGDEEEVRRELPLLLHNRPLEDKKTDRMSTRAKAQAKKERKEREWVSDQDDCCNIKHHVDGCVCHHANALSKAQRLLCNVDQWDKAKSVQDLKAQLKIRSIIGKRGGGIPTKWGLDECKKRLREWVPVHFQKLSSKKLLAMTKKVKACCLTVTPVDETPVRKQRKSRVKKLKATRYTVSRPDGAICGGIRVTPAFQGARLPTESKLNKATHRQWQDKVLALLRRRTPRGIAWEWSGEAGVWVWRKWAFV